VIAVELFGLQRSQVTPATSLRDLKGDELDYVELIMELEDHFEVSIPDDDDTERLVDEAWRQKTGEITMAKLAGKVDELKRRAPGPSGSSTGS